MWGLTWSEHVPHRVRLCLKRTRSMAGAHSWPQGSRQGLLSNQPCEKKGLRHPGRQPPCRTPAEALGWESPLIPASGVAGWEARGSVFGR